MTIGLDAKADAGLQVQSDSDFIVVAVTPKHVGDAGFEADGVGEGALAGDLLGEYNVSAWNGDEYEWASVQHTFAEEDFKEPQCATSWHLLTGRVGENGMFDRLVVDKFGHVNVMHALGLPPNPAPAAPATGFLLFCDEADGHLKAISAAGVVSTIV